MRAGPAIAIGIGVLVAIFVASQGRGQNDGRQDSVQHDTGRGLIASAPPPARPQVAAPPAPAADADTEALLKSLGM